MSDRKKPPTYYDILSYWDKQDCFTASNGDLWNPLLDIREPSCQCCGTYNPRYDIPEYETFSDDDDEKTIKQKRKNNRKLIEKAWQNNCFNKAHIVPHRVGGKNIASNYLILCKDCHYEFDNAIFIEKHGDDLTLVVDFMKECAKMVSEMKSKAIKDVVEEFDFDQEKQQKLMECVCKNFHKYKPPLVLNKKKTQQFGLEAIYARWYNLIRTFAFSV